MSRCVTVYVLRLCDVKCSGFLMILSDAFIYRRLPKSLLHPVLNSQSFICSFIIMSLAATYQHQKVVFVPNELELRVPLAIGTLQWGTTIIDEKLVNTRGGVLNDETVSEIIDIVAISPKNGRVALFDTAEGYGGGTSEKRLGRLLVAPRQQQQQQQQQQEQPPDTTNKIILMTKFLPAPWRLFHSDLEHAVRKSCQRLQVDCIPIYLLHSPVHWLRDIEYWVEACAMCRQKGLIQAMGLSNCNADQVRRAVAAGKKYGVPVVCNQVHYSLLDYNSQALQEMEQACRELNVVIVAFSPIGQGLLTENLTNEKYRANKPAKMLRLKWDDVQPLRSVVSGMAKKYNKTMAQVALNWCIQHNVVPLVGCRSSSQAKDSVGCLGWALSDVDVRALDKVALDRSTLDSRCQKLLLLVVVFLFWLQSVCTELNLYSIVLHSQVPGGGVCSLFRCLVLSWLCVGLWIRLDWAVLCHWRRVNRK